MRESEGLGDPPDGSLPAGLNRGGGISSGKLKVYESKKVKKRRALLLNESTSEESLVSPRENRNLSSGPVKNKLDPHGATAEDEVKRRTIKSGSAATAVELKIEKDRVFDGSAGFVQNDGNKRLKCLSKTLNENYRCSDASEYYKSAKRDMRRCLVDRDDKCVRRAHASNHCSSDDHPNKKMNISRWKHREEDGSNKVNRGERSKSHSPIARLREEDARYNRNIDRKRGSTLKINGRTAEEWTIESGHNDRKRLKLPGDEDDTRLAGRAREGARVHWDRGIRVQGKGGVLKVIPTRDVRLGSFRKRYCLREVDNRKKFVPGSHCNDDPVLVRNKLNDRVLASRSPVNKYSLDSKGKMGLPETVGISSSESNNTDSSSTQTKVKTKGQSHSAITGSMSSKNTSRQENGHPTEVPKRQVHLENTRTERLVPSVTILKNKKEKKSEKLVSPVAMLKYTAEKRLSNGKGKGDLQIQKTDDSSVTVSRRMGASASVTVKKNQKNTASVSRSINRQGGRNREKQFLRERIKSMLLKAGWTIDMRPRRGRFYNDLVYISPAGTGYWSIVKAYHALEKQFDYNDKSEDGKSDGVSSSFSSISAAILSLLTRNTRKKRMREEMANKLKDVRERKNEATVLKVREKRKLNLITENKNKKTMAKFKTNGSAQSQKSRSLSEEVGCSNEDWSDDDGKSANAFVKESELTLEKEKKHKTRRRCGLLVRSANKGDGAHNENFVHYHSKLSILSWLIDSGTVPENGKVQYMNRKRNQAMLDGWITREGIHCSCCSKILSVSRFEIHAGSKLHQPFRHIFLETGVSLLQCQLDAWNRQDKSDRSGFYFIETDGDDPNDDTCGICGDGGDLICCDSCPSTFHQSCLNMKTLPPGDWHCSNCTCRICGFADATAIPLRTCCQCEKKYHQACVGEIDSDSVNSDDAGNSFCGMSCRKVFQHLRKLLGVKNDLDAGFSWTLIRRFDVDSSDCPYSLDERAEWNSKVAVALALMDECFLPIIDQRSCINLIHNVVYNCGSNFTRLNYSGFYTVVLERDDEFISAATLRIHGTRLAEMPFIGTRHMYRRQGMCRRLLNALEMALCSLNVKDLIIPAISELTHTWTVVFGFKSLEESHKQDMKSLNMLVFPAADLLQKSLLKHEISTGNETSVLEAVEPWEDHSRSPEMQESGLFSSPLQHNIHDIEESDTTVHRSGKVQAGAGDVNPDSGVFDELLEGNNVVNRNQFMPEALDADVQDGTYIKPSIDTNVIMDQSCDEATCHKGSCEGAVHLDGHSMHESGIPPCQAVKEDPALFSHVEDFRLNSDPSEISYAAASKEQNSHMVSERSVSPDTESELSAVASAPDTCKVEGRDTFIKIGETESCVCTSRATYINDKDSNILYGLSEGSCCVNKVVDGASDDPDVGCSEKVARPIEIHSSEGPNAGVSVTTAESIDTNAEFSNFKLYCNAA